MFVVSAPGKIILFGEHAVVYGKPAIAAAVDLRTYLYVGTDNDENQGHSAGDENTIRLQLPDIGLDHSWDRRNLVWPSSISSQAQSRLDTVFFTRLQKSCLADIPDALHRVAAATFLYLYTHIVPREIAGQTYLVRSNLPIGAGLGSSASISVCFAAAFAILAGWTQTAIEVPLAMTPGSLLTAQSPLELINDWSFVGELCMHGNPSGIDNAVATHGGAIFFQREPAIRRPIAALPPIKLVLTNTGHPRRTADLVAGVKLLRDELTSTTTAIFDAIEHLTEEAYSAITARDSVCDKQLDPRVSERLQTLFRINQGLLLSLGVSHPKLDQIRASATHYNIGETKLTGAGGGGCAITLVQSDTSPLALTQFREQLETPEVGFKVYETTLGGKGVAYASETVSATLYRSLEGAQLQSRGNWVYW
ncbi:mevalonate kinase, partial [Nadsonia fulvescens var. elongata DSM 6958]